MLEICDRIYVTHNDKSIHGLHDLSCNLAYSTDDAYMILLMKIFARMCIVGISLNSYKRTYVVVNLKPTKNEIITHMF